MRVCLTKLDYVEKVELGRSGVMEQNHCYYLEQARSVCLKQVRKVLLELMVTL